MPHNPISLAAVNPIPIESVNAAIVIFLCENPAYASNSIPDTMNEPNIIIVHPPNRDSGKEAKK